MKKATYGQRIASVLIDILIVGVIYLIFSTILSAVMAMEEPQVYVDLYNKLMNGELDYLAWYEQYLDLATNNAEVMAYINHQNTVAIAELIGTVAIYVAYFIILPLCWKDGQTVGRFALKIKVKDEDSDDLSVSTAIIRELIGGLLISIILNCCCCIPLLVNLVMLGKGHSIADAISHSEVVSTTDVDLNTIDTVQNFAGSKPADGIYHFEEDNK